MSSRQPPRTPSVRQLLPGEALEKGTYRYFKAEINADRFYARRTACTIFRKKPYYSRDRQGDIVFDVAIEIVDPKTKRLCLLILIECKDSARTVSVEEVEEFHSKINQVSGSKGILVSSAGFQRGTLRFAESKRIALVRYFAPDQVKWELRRALLSDESGACVFASREEVLRGLAGESPVSLCSRVNGCHGSTITNVPGFLIKSLCEEALSDQALLSRLRVDSKGAAQVAFIAPEQIREEARSMLRRVRYAGGAIDLERICNDRANAMGLTLRQRVTPSQAERSAGVLGRVRFDPLEIVIFDGDDAEAVKRRFTLGHELGHVVLDHGRYIEAESCDSGDIDSDDAMLGDTDLARLEWQANRFASELLMPRDEFESDFWALAARHDIRNRGFGALFVDSQPCNRQSFFAIANELSARYGVSRSAVAVRLKALELLKLGTLAGTTESVRAILGRAERPTTIRSTEGRSGQ